MWVLDLHIGFIILATSAGSVGEYIVIVFEKNFSWANHHGNTFLSQMVDTV